MPILALPVDILLTLTPFLDQTTLSRLSRTCRTLHFLLTPALSKLKVFYLVATYLIPYNDASAVIATSSTILAVLRPLFLGYAAMRREYDMIAGPPMPDFRRYLEDEPERIWRSFTIEIERKRSRMRGGVVHLEGRVWVGKMEYHVRRSLQARAANSFGGYLLGLCGRKV